MVIGMKVLTGSQMYRVEQAQVEDGMTFTRLMENAGSACARVIRERFPELPEKGGRVCVVCGKGKNGGDGYVVARKLALAGYNTTLVMAYGEPQAQDAILMREKLHDTGLVHEYAWGDAISMSALRRADVIVDAVFGTGYRYREDEKTEQIFSSINEASGKVVSIDVPSGSESDSGECAPLSIKADITIAISCYKPVHVIKPACCLCGEVVTVDIGLSDSAYDVLDEPILCALTKKEAADMLPKRDVMSHKGTFGHALSICGSRNMQGAAVLAARGAVRCGAGLLTAAFPEAAYNAIASKLTEPLMLPLPSNTAGTFASGAIPLAEKAMENKSAVLIGCGMGLNLDTKELLEFVIKNCKAPLIIDADGINALACNIDILKQAAAPVIVTPHPGEMARLTGKTIAEIEQSRVLSAQSFADEYNAVVLLKGASTVIAEPGGSAVYVNTTGNPGMAKGGSGDLLAGIILALLSQGVSPFKSAVLGAYLHGAAGDTAAGRLSLMGVTPSDCADALPELLKNFE